MCRYGKVLNKAILHAEAKSLCKTVSSRIQRDFYYFIDLEICHPYKIVWLYCGGFDATKNKYHHSTKMRLIRRKLIKNSEKERKYLRKM